MNKRDHNPRCKHARFAAAADTPAKNQTLEELAAASDQANDMGPSIKATLTSASAPSVIHKLTKPVPGSDRCGTRRFACGHRTACQLGISSSTLQRSDAAHLRATATMNVPVLQRLTQIQGPVTVDATSNLVSWLYTTGNCTLFRLKSLLPAHR